MLDARSGGQEEPACVRPGLYLSSLRTECCREALEAVGITHVLQVGVELRPSHPRHFVYLSMPVYDMPEQDIVACFPQAFAFIDQALAAGGRVLVHCQAGVSRSATVVVAWVMRAERLATDAAIAAVAAARPCIWPNAGFKCQLREFEALGCDAGRWPGWTMQTYLRKQYGDESVGFMAAMLGGAPVDRLARSTFVPAAARVRPQPPAPSPRAEQPSPRASPRQQRHAQQAPGGAGPGGGGPGALALEPPAEAADAQPNRGGGGGSDINAGAHADAAHAACGACCGGSKGRPSSAAGGAGAPGQPGVGGSRSGTGARRASLACYGAGSSAAWLAQLAGASGSSRSGGGSGGGGSSSGRRMRRHSTSSAPYAAAAAAAAAAASVAGMAAVDLGSTRAMHWLAEDAALHETALLMAG